MEGTTNIQTRYFALCVFTCTFVFVGCLYCTWLFVQMQEINSRCLQVLQQIDKHDVSMSNDGISKSQPFVYESKSRLKRATAENTKKRRKKKPKTKKKRSKAKAAHYHSYITDENMDKYISGYDEGKTTSTSFNETCQYVVEMKGTLCRSKDFVTNSTHGTLHLFKKSDWVTTKMEPFQMNDHGLFEAKYSGVYLVYAQILFKDNKHSMIVGLVQERPSKPKPTIIQELGCFETADPNRDPEYVSCGVTGLFFLEKGDTLSLRNVLSDVKMNLKSKSTYFGAVYLK